MDELYIKIRNLRKAKGMSQEELSKLTGYKGRSAIAKLESGHFDIGIDKVKLFANALGTTPAYLMGWDEDEKLGTLIDTIEATNQDDRLAFFVDKLQTFTDEELEEVKKFIEFIEIRRG